MSEILSTWFMNGPFSKEFKIWKSQTYKIWCLLWLDIVNKNSVKICTFIIALVKLKCIFGNSNCGFFSFYSRNSRFCVTYEILVSPHYSQAITLNKKTEKLWKYIEQVKSFLVEQVNAEGVRNFFNAKFEKFAFQI